MANNTGNPIGSIDLRDLQDNARNLDFLINGDADFYYDRFNKKRVSLAGLTKRIEGLTEDIKNFGGSIVVDPSWSDIPSNNSEELGGALGPLNKQAKALGDRTELLKKQSREALRRSYAEVGLNLVDGSFEEGGVVTNPTDILLQETTGLAFGLIGNDYPKIVDENTIPNSQDTPEWLEKSEIIFKNILSLENGIKNIGGVGYITPEQYSDNGVSNSIAFSLAAVAAAEKRWIVKLSNKEYFLDSDVDMKFVSIVGGGITKIIGPGMLKNTGFIKDIKIANFNVSDTVEGIIPSLEKTGLIMVPYGPDSFYILSKNSAKQGYVSIRMRAAPAGGEGPWEFIREQSAFSCLLAFAYESIEPSYGKAVYTGSGWTTFDFTAAVLGMPSGTTSGAENAFCVGGAVASTIGSYVDITASCNDNGEFSISFLRTPGSGGILDVYLDKGEGLPTINSDGTSNIQPDVKIFTGSEKIVIRKIKLNSPKDFGRVRIVSRSNNRSYILGANVDVPEETNKQINYDNWAYYRSPTSEAYVVNTGASDYAMRDLDKGSLVGSYHGSESKVTDPKWVLDGTRTSNFIINKPLVAKEILLVQHTLINNKITAKSEHSFGNGWVQKLITLSGEMRANTVYLGMCLPQVINLNDNKDCFTELLYPININVKNEGEYAIGGCNLVIWRNPNTEARVYAYHRNFINYNAKNGPAYIKTAYGSSSYSKLYHNLQKDAENQFNTATTQIIHLYA